MPQLRWEIPFGWTRNKAKQNNTTKIAALKKDAGIDLAQPYRVTLDPQRGTYFIEQEQIEDATQPHPTNQAVGT